MLNTKKQTLDDKSKKEKNEVCFYCGKSVKLARKTGCGWTMNGKKMCTGKFPQC